MSWVPCVLPCAPMLPCVLGPLSGPGVRCRLLPSAVDSAVASSVVPVSHERGMLAIQAGRVDLCDIRSWQVETSHHRHCREALFVRQSRTHAAAAGAATLTFCSVLFCSVLFCSPPSVCAAMAMHALFCSVLSACGGATRMFCSVHLQWLVRSPRCCLAGQRAPSCSARCSETDEVLTRPPFCSCLSSSLTPLFRVMPAGWPLTISPSLSSPPHLASRRVRVIQPSPQRSAFSAAVFAPVIPAPHSTRRSALEVNPTHAPRRSTPLVRYATPRPRHLTPLLRRPTPPHVAPQAGFYSDSACLLVTASYKCQCTGDTSCWMAHLPACDCD